MLPSTEQRLQYCKQKVLFCSDYHGRYWARTSDPQLVDSEQRSPQFAGVRSRRMVQRNPKASERFSERERTPSVAIVATRIQISATVRSRRRSLPHQAERGFGRDPAQVHPLWLAPMMHARRATRPGARTHSISSSRARQSSPAAPPIAFLQQLERGSHVRVQLATGSDPAPATGVWLAFGVLR